MKLEVASLRGSALRRSPVAEFVDSAVRGDPIAFSEVYRRYRTPVYAFCLSRLMQPPAAEDATQEVFVRLISAEPGSIRNPLAWLFGVARNVCIDVARGREREVATALEQLDMPDSRDTEMSVTMREKSELIAFALRSINPRYRMALVMHEMHANSPTEIAAAFGISMSATYTLLSRSRDSFEAAYRRAEQLSAPCRQALAVMHSRRTEGVPEIEELRLQQHLRDCTDCAVEARRLARTERLSALGAALAFPSMLRWRLVSHFHPASILPQLAPEALQATTATMAVAVTIALAALGSFGALEGTVAPPTLPIEWHAENQSGESPCTWATSARIESTVRAAENEFTRTRTRTGSDANVVTRVQTRCASGVTKSPADARPGAQEPVGPVHQATQSDGLAVGVTSPVRAQVNAAAPLGVAAGGTNLERESTGPERE
ncbi:MAG: RNA polymerase sigma factor [Actinomycetota bacterium]|nr:RNA polymerase sigma factor [Actinomycetota bacterium]